MPFGESLNTPENFANMLILSPEEVTTIKHAIDYQLGRVQQRQPERLGENQQQVTQGIEVLGQLSAVVSESAEAGTRLELNLDSESKTALESALFARRAMNDKGLTTEKISDNRVLIENKQNAINELLSRLGAI